jgi:ABC-type dipeptide/oligopeptide/nickel transport system permease component
MIVFSIKLTWFPMAGGGDLSNMGSVFLYGLLPAASGGLGMASYLTRISRTAMLEVLNEDYIRTARAKGVKRFTVISKHALRNSLISIVSVISIYAVVMVGDSITIEIAFSRPGFGRLIFGAITQRDYFLIQAIIFFYVIFATLINLATDLLYAIIDPRISYK